MQKIYTLLFIVSACIIQANAQCPSGRYLNQTFTVDTNKAIQFGINTPASGTGSQPLYMDVYMPHGDTMQHRPVVIFAHGGSFIGGTRTDQDVAYFCHTLATRGYLCASIDYRLESIVNVSNTQKMVTEVIRAQQDGKAAVRFFRENAATTNSYKVDDQQIFMGGSSAGAVLAIHAAYMDTIVDALPATWLTWGNAIGGLEGSSGHPGYSSKIKAVVSFAGAIGDTAWMELPEVPFIEFHSANDATVLDGTGYPLSIPTLPSLSGGKIMNMRANSINMYHEYHQFPGSLHPPYNGAAPSVLDSIENQTVRFLYSLIECNPDHVSGIHENSLEKVELSVYPNPIHEQLNIKFPYDCGSYDVTVTDQLGRSVIEMTNGKGTELQIDTKNLRSGMYFLNVNFINKKYAAFSSKVLVD